MPGLKGWLKTAIIESNTPKHSIIEALRPRLGGFQNGRDRSVLHASDITKPSFCPRHEAILDTKNITKGQGYFVNTALQVTFDIGNMTEELFVERWAGDIVYGHWRCRRCGKSATMTNKPETGCIHSKDCIWKYRQFSVQAPEYGVSGSTDALLNVGTPKLLVTELKIMGPEQFDDIVIPLPEHRIRTALYLKLIAESNSVYKDNININEGRVLYVSRAFGKKNDNHKGEVLPFKEFVVERQDEVLAPLLQKATQLKIFREQKLLPSGICNTALDKTAKTCSSCKECFSGAMPSQQEKLL